MTNRRDAAGPSYRRAGFLCARVGEWTRSLGGEGLREFMPQRAAQPTRRGGDLPLFV